jgi:hypothetical protein
MTKVKQITVDACFRKKNGLITEFGIEILVK